MVGPRPGQALPQLRHWEQGPMVRAWTMRYEEKLKYFKGVSRSGNFKNITYTLARRHQKWLAYHMQNSLDCVLI